MQKQTSLSGTQGRVNPCRSQYPYTQIMFSSVTVILFWGWWGWWWWSHVCWCLFRFLCDVIKMGRGGAGNKAGGWQAPPAANQDACLLDGCQQALLPVLPGSLCFVAPHPHPPALTASGGLAPAQGPQQACPAPWTSGGSSPGRYGESDSGA